MTAKEYLAQIRRLDGLINSKLAILSTLEASATSTSAVTEVEPVSHTRNVHALQDTVVKIMELREEINSDTDALVDLREEVQRVIHRVDDARCQTVLILRYVWLKPWKDIAAALSYSVRAVYKVRDRAIEKLDAVLLQSSIESVQSCSLADNS